MELRAFLIAEAVERGADGRFSVARIVSNYAYPARSLPAPLPPLWAFLSVGHLDAAMQVRVLLEHPDRSAHWMCDWIALTSAPTALAQEWAWQLAPIPVSQFGICAIKLVREVVPVNPPFVSQPVIEPIAQFRFPVVAV